MDATRRKRCPRRCSDPEYERECEGESSELRGKEHLTERDDGKSFAHNGPVDEEDYTNCFDS